MNSCLNKAINNTETNGWQSTTQMGMETKMAVSGSVPPICKHSNLIRVPPSAKRCSL